MSILKEMQYAKWMKTWRSLPSLLKLNNYEIMYGTKLVRVIKYFIKLKEGLRILQRRIFNTIILTVPFLPVVDFQMKTQSRAILAPAWLKPLLHCLPGDKGIFQRFLISMNEIINDFFFYWEC